MPLPACSTTDRVMAVDAVRGLAILLLIPDVDGAFGLPRAARMAPEDATWQAVARQFIHAPWVGARLWDFIMPVFAFVVGVSMALSIERERTTGAGTPDLAIRALLRVATLVVLGLLLLFDARSPVEQMLFIFVLASAVPDTRRSLLRAARWLWLRVAVLVVTSAWIGAHPSQLAVPGISSQILILLALAYIPAFGLSRLSTPLIAFIAALTIGVYGAAFAIFPDVGSTAGIGVSQVWAKGTNLGAALDRWLYFDVLHLASFHDDPHGYVLVQFVPLISTMLAGALVGRMLARGTAPRTVAMWLAVAGSLLLVSGLLLDLSGIPIVKSIWTPSWFLISTAAAVLLLAGSLLLLAGPAERLAMPLVVLGSNAVMMYVVGYVMTHHQRWRLVDITGRFVGATWMSLPWHQVAIALIQLALLYLLAWGLYRRRIFVRA